MSLFQPPPHTRYDLKFTLMGIPVRVHPLFWLMVLLLGVSSGGIVHLLIWVVVVFVSILVHELGHSLAMRMYGQSSSIVLHLFGGLAVPESSWRGSRWSDVSLSAMQQVFISLAGPFAGFLLAGIILAVIAAWGGQIFLNWWLGVVPLPTAVLPAGGWFVSSVVRVLLWVNIFWGLINLVPVYPLDGGNVARHLFVKFDPWDGMRKSLWLSVISGAMMAIVGLVLMNSVFMALLFGFLAFQSYQTVQGRSDDWL